jgi:hypothetical protein
MASRSHGLAGIDSDQPITPHTTRLHGLLPLVGMDDVSSGNLGAKQTLLTDPPLSSSRFIHLASIPTDVRGNFSRSLRRITFAARNERFALFSQVSVRPRSRSIQHPTDIRSRHAHVLCQCCLTDAQPNHPVVQVSGSNAGHVRNGLEADLVCQVRSQPHKIIFRAVHTQVQPVDRSPFCSRTDQYLEWRDVAPRL